MMVKWSEDAINDLRALHDYICRDKITAANHEAKKILHAVELLSQQPEIGRRGRIVGTRELIVYGAPYIIPYRVKNNIIELLRVYHCAMQWPEKL